eukprot:3734582-Rhodomonas_salina.1
MSEICQHTHAAHAVMSDQNSHVSDMTASRCVQSTHTHTGMHVGRDVCQAIPARSCTASRRKESAHHTAPYMARTA